jgi:hypothetical protein
VDLAYFKVLVCAFLYGVNMIVFISFVADDVKA